MATSYYIAVSGLMGSGKTTLCTSLSKEFGWLVAPKKNPTKNYLTDLFSNMERWAFEAQLGFLTDKSLEIIGLIENNKSFILDRSIYEDYLVFAQYFFNSGKIDERGFVTYSEIAAYFISKIQPPDLIIHCKCSTSTAEDRIFKKRKDRDYQHLYPDGHLEEINLLYEKLYDNFSDCPVYFLDSEKYDFRKKDTVKFIFNETLSLLNYSNNSEPELDLFGPISNKIQLDCLQKIVSVEEFNRPKSMSLKIITDVKKVPQYPFAYIAAPFTSKAIDKKSIESDGLFQTPPLHGIISPKSEFRRMLLGIENKIKKLGISSLIPHRDVSKWGKLYVSPNDVFDNCSFHVSNCSIFIGILGESNGSHYEFGLAFALEKPTILIRCEEIANSYISQGIQDLSKKIKILSCKTTQQIPELFSSLDFLVFIKEVLQ